MSILLSIKLKNFSHSICFLDESKPRFSTFPKPLTNTQVEQLREVHGYNIIVTGKALAWYRVLFNAMVHPFNMLLIILAVASGAQGDIDSMCIMIIMVFLSSGIRFFQEWKSLVAAKSLRRLVSNKVCAMRYTFTGDPDQRAFNEMRRNTIEKEIPLEDIVPGDWIKLSAGDLIPADIQIIDSKDLFVSQSSLTGEALPVEKYAANFLTNNVYRTRSLNSNNSHSESISSKSEVRVNIQNINRYDDNIKYKFKINGKKKIYFPSKVKNCET
jgi:Mg2+-importing ATPase